MDDKNLMNPKKIIHIGLPKTATTSLQALLSESNEIYYLGRHVANFKDNDLKFAIWIQLLESDSLTLDIKPVKSIISNHYNIAKQQGRKAFVLSEESITAPWWSNVSFKERLERLKFVFGADAQIILTLREQTSFVQSIYKELLKIGLDCTFNEFFQYILLRYNTFLMPYLNYHQVIEFCRMYFNDIQIFLYEDIVNDINSQSAFIKFFQIQKKTILPKLNDSQKTNLGDFYTYNRKNPYMISSGFKGFNLCDFFRRNFLNLNVSGWKELDKNATLNYQRHYDIMSKAFNSSSIHDNDSLFNVDPAVKNEFDQFIGKWNRNLIHRYNIPIDSYGYYLK
ncbi:hypothetical protein MHK_005470 [Candidatus Magnetomorum sp. HK-1]|nr:hypothetical protein MHK_005470 [Candidatus Magnetomorum sp. HK-1]